jgi:hypothetical protein
MRVKNFDEHPDSVTEEISWQRRITINLPGYTAWHAVIWLVILFVCLFVSQSADLSPSYLGSRSVNQQGRCLLYWSFVKSFLPFKVPSQVCPCHHGMTRLRVADKGDGLHMWRVAVNILNKQSRTADKEWPSSLGVGRGAKNSSP